MKNDNTNNTDRLPNPITAPVAAGTADLIGEAILRCVSDASQGKPINPAILMAISVGLAQVRIYLAYRDQDELTDENSLRILETARQLKRQKERKHDESVSAAADEILADLRNSGIDI